MKKEVIISDVDLVKALALTGDIFSLTGKLWNYLHERNILKQVGKIPGAVE